MMNIKVFLVLVIISGALSYDIDCSADVETICGKINDDWKGQSWPEDEEQLNRACNVGSTLDCQIDFAERCPKTLLRAFLNYLLETKNLYKELCGSNDDFKIKYLENVKCLNEHVTNLFNTCKQTTKGNLVDLCRNSKVTLKCVVEGVSEKCDTQAIEVFQVLSQPMLAIETIFCKKS